MSVADTIRPIVASILKVSPAALANESDVAALNSSINRFKLTLGLRSAGLKLTNAACGPTFGALVQSFEGGDSESAVENSVEPAEMPIVEAIQETESPEIQREVRSNAVANIKLGLDLEMVAQLPEVADIWEDPFYQNAFTPSELARAQTTPSPRVHLAGIWCAKEALKKTSKEFLTLPLLRIEIAHEADGAPFMRVREGDTWKPVICSVSISHTDQFAAAVVAMPTFPAQP